VLFHPVTYKYKNNNLRKKKTFWWSWFWVLIIRSYYINEVGWVLQWIPRSDGSPMDWASNTEPLTPGAVLQWNWHQTWKMIRNQDRAKKLEPKKVSG
jgi:hypothetical protein